MAAGLSEIPVAATGGSTGFAASCLTKSERSIGWPSFPFFSEEKATRAARFLVPL